MLLPDEPLEEPLEPGEVLDPLEPLEPPAPLEPDEPLDPEEPLLPEEPPEVCAWAASTRHAAQNAVTFSNCFLINLPFVCCFSLGKPTPL
jgi:hypothetical protein